MVVCRVRADAGTGQSVGRVAAIGRVNKVAHEGVCWAVLKMGARLSVLAAVSLALVGSGKAFLQSPLMKGAIFWYMHTSVL